MNFMLPYMSIGYYKSPKPTKTWYIKYAVHNTPASLQQTKALGRA